MHGRFAIPPRPLRVAAPARDEMRADVKKIDARAKFGDPFERRRVLKVLDEAIEKLGQRLAAQGEDG